MLVLLPIDSIHCKTHTQTENVKNSDEWRVHRINFGCFRKMSTTKVAAVVTRLYSLHCFTISAEKVRFDAILAQQFFAFFEQVFRSVGQFIMFWYGKWAERLAMEFGYVVEECGRLFKAFRCRNPIFAVSLLLGFGSVYIAHDAEKCFQMWLNICDTITLAVRCGRSGCRCRSLAIDRWRAVQRRMYGIGKVDGWLWTECGVAENTF